MNIEIIKSDKNDMEFQIDNLTIAEILREYLNRQGIQFAAWRREHPSKPILMKIQGNKSVGKEVSEAVEAIKKDCNEILSVLKRK